jgi:hypothetical protein
MGIIREESLGGGGGRDQWGEGVTLRGVLLHYVTEIEFNL